VGKDPLATYAKKRDFRRTPEPAGKAARVNARTTAFVVQKHAATALHYDFRLEAEGVLKSWAIPKGPSLNPKDKRLAMQTEDHPLGYLRFEGEIPEGNYGAGPVIVWDIGTYSNLSDEPMAQALRRGHVKFSLNGKKLQGAFALTRLAEKPRPRWLLVKMNDEHASLTDITRALPDSVLSGLAIEVVHDPR
jgi:bifunctional non-homologous end joining protein LigD